MGVHGKGHSFVLEFSLVKLQSLIELPNFNLHRNAGDIYGVTRPIVAIGPYFWIVWLPFIALPDFYVWVHIVGLAISFRANQYLYVYTEDGTGARTKQEIKRISD